jgi:hypothetical protein
LSGFLPQKTSHTIARISFKNPKLGKTFLSAMSKQENIHNQETRLEEYFTRKLHSKRDHVRKAQWYVWIAQLQIASSQKKNSFGNLHLERFPMQFPKFDIHKIRNNIPRKGIGAHSCVCEQFINSQDWSAYSAAGKYVDRSWEYINPLAHERENWAAKFLIWEYIMGFLLQCRKI